MVNSTFVDYIQVLLLNKVIVMCNKQIPTAEQVLEYRSKAIDFDTMSDSEVIDIQLWCLDFEEKYDFETKVYEENGKFGVKDVLGEVLVPAIYESIEYTHGDWDRFNPVPASMNGKMALVASDGKGTPCTDFIFDSTSYDEGYYFMEKDGKSGFADLDGYMYLPAEADVIYEPEPYCDVVTYEIGEKQGYVSLAAKVATGALYDACELDDDGFLVVSKDGVKGYIDVSGNFTLDESCKYFSAALYVDLGEYAECAYTGDDCF